MTFAKLPPQILTKIPKKKNPISAEELLLPLMEAVLPEHPKKQFQIKTQSAYGIRQKHIERDTNVLESFNNTTVLSTILKQPRKTFASGLLGISSGNP